MEKIRIFYAADLHGDFDSLKTVKKYLEGENFDINFINGDHIHIPFSKKEFEDYINPQQEGQEMIKEFAEKKGDLLQKIITQHETMPKLIEKIIPPETFGEIQSGEITDMELYALRDNAEIPLDSGIRGAISSYIQAKDKLTNFQKSIEKHEEQYVKIAEKNMIKSYKEFKKILSGIDYITLPGNHDGKCLEGILGEESLHNKSKTIKDIKVAGYGGAAVIMPMITSAFVEFIEGHIEQEGKEIEMTEAELIFLKEKPDIIVTHEVPLGAIPGVGHKRLGLYVTQRKPALVLAAHMHEFHGTYPFQINDKSVLVMPGKLGRTEGKYAERYNNLRTFAEIEATKSDGLAIDKVTIKRLTDKNEIKTLSEYFPNSL